MSETTSRVLLVEDDRAWQQILQEIFEDMNLAVDMADSLESAMENLRAVPHRLAIVDLALGGGDYDNQDGLRVLEAVRLQDPGCVPIMLTGFATVELAVRVLTEYGAFSCLRKEGFNRAEFRALVHRALASAPMLPSGDEADVTDFLEASGAVAAEASDGAISSGSVLVVEDDAGWRGILSELLEDAGYRVRLCAGYGEALGCLQRESYTLAVVDLSLSVALPPAAQSADNRSLSGYQLLECAGACGVPTLVVSGVAAPEDIPRIYAEYNVFAYLEKQRFDRRAFLQTVIEAHTAFQAGRLLHALTPREREVLELLVEGMTNKEMAEALFITTNTVKRHLKAIFNKLDVHTRAAAVAKAFGAGMSA